jgi:hypothetical protein
MAEFLLSKSRVCIIIKGEKPLIVPVLEKVPHDAIESTRPALVMLTQNHSQVCLLRQVFPCTIRGTVVNDDKVLKPHFSTAFECPD